MTVDSTEPRRHPHLMGDGRQGNIDLMTDSLADFGLDVLNQRSARCDVDDLQASAHASIGSVVGERQPGELQIECVARSARFLGFRMT